MEDSAGGGATKKETEENISNGYRVIYVLGRPGSGKTTQCSKISSQFGFCHLIIGSLLQEEAESGSKDGKMILDLKKEGKLVPSEIVVQLLQKAMEKSKSKTFLIDGFPRSEENLAAAESIMKIEPDLVLLFDCSEEESARRLLNRNQGREDDNVETIKKRLRVYSESTAPVVDHYSSRGKIQKIDAERPIEEVYESVKSVLLELKNERGTKDM